MNIPSVPTDNLYKFSAIFGLILFIGAIYLYQVSDRNIHDAKIRSELSHAKRTQDSIDSDFKTKVALIKTDIRKEIKDSNPQTLDADYFFGELDRLDKETQENLEISNNYTNSINESYKNDVDLVYYEYEQKLYVSVAKKLVIVGILLIAWGFASWYFKHQIYIDAEIRWKGQTFRELLKDADSIKKSNTVKTDEDKFNDEQPPSS